MRGPIVGDLASYSASIQSGGNSQVAVPANRERRYLLIINISNTDLWVNFGVAATPDSPSIPLRAASANGAGDGGSLVFESNFVPGGAVHIYGATTGRKFIIREG